MADICDLGNDCAEQMLADALARRPRLREGVPSALFCEDCDEAIPARRREMVPGCVMCVDCQQLREDRYV